MNLKTIAFLLLNIKLCFGVQIQSITGKTIDLDNNADLGSVLITNTKTNTTTTSESNGFFLVKEPGIYSFKKNGYLEKQIELKADQNYIIQLSLNPSFLEEVIVEASHIPKTLKKATSSISLISKKNIELSNNINVVSALNRAPGVFMQTGALNTNRITIRGIGSRNLFGTSKIRAYLNDIPLTNGSGETNIEDLELGTISRLEIHKGAVSSIYGAGLGGTIELFPEKPKFEGTILSNEFTIGSFGLIKNLTNLNLSNQKIGFNAVYSNTQSNGYRDNNTYNRQTLTLSSNYFIDDNNQLFLLASLINLKAFIPSALNEEDFLNNPRSAAFTWNRAMGFEDYNRGVFGISWTHKYPNETKHITSVFASFRDAYEPRPFNILQEDTFATGLRSRLLGYTKLFGILTKWTLGGELFRDTYEHKTFENLYEDFPSGTGSIGGDQLSDFKERRSYYNVFFETNHEISDKTTLSIGLNLNETSYRLKDFFPVSEENQDQSGNFKFKNILSPKLGVSYQLSKNISTFVNTSHGFSPISLEETLLPDGQINTSLQPETGWDFEIGTRGSLAENRLQFNFSIYRLAIKNLLVSRRTSQDQFIGINAGKTRHDGLEASLNYNLISTQNFNLNVTTNFSLNNYKFKEFIDNENNFSNNDLTGVPSEVFNAIIDFNSEFGFYGNLNFQHVGQIPITDSNSLYSESYNITNYRIGFRKNLNKNLKINVFTGLNNIFDRQYASQVLINAVGFGGRQPRYYYPGNPINYYCGINLKYAFQ
ncbi:TonB-dependent receptor domain-containing protein [Seonamhaeicola sp. ML3]|uniref:TonB-dependent receptor family protein n=1 Tax=Seonamhaeicola sp. ML3 TaxID=2937786 RepID=UPI002010AB39|nr:TonB-dependent receptor [Seonamhaeicola sp. ML3]